MNIEKVKKIITKELKFKGGTIKVHGILTGKLAIKKSALSSEKPGTLSTILSLKDKHFGEWLPIWSWLIEHPEGMFMIDTGLSIEVNDKDYFKRLDRISKYYFEKQMKFEIEREDELSNQLDQIGIECKSIDKVLLTHLHLDHTGGLKHFIGVPILVNKKEWETKDGSYSQLFPENLKIEKIRLTEKFENFNNCYHLTGGKDLIFVETPGHTSGHCSIILKLDKSHLIIFGGDVVYNEKRLAEKIFSATIKNKKQNEDSCDRILNLFKTKQILFLPSHDKESGDRLLKFTY